MPEYRFCAGMEIQKTRGLLFYVTSLDEPEGRISTKLFALLNFVGKVILVEKSELAKENIYPRRLKRGGAWSFDWEAEGAFDVSVMDVVSPLKQNFWKDERFVGELLDILRNWEGREKEEARVAQLYGRYFDSYYAL